MIHTFSLIAEFTYDDENGEYPAPTEQQVERSIRSVVRSLHQYSHMGFDLKETVFEVSKGNLSEAFGIDK